MAELEIASDDYRTVEKRYYNVSKVFMSAILVVCSLGALAFLIVPSQWLDQSVMILVLYSLITIILGIVLRYEIGIYFSHFTILRAKRYYEFHYHHHCSHEIPLAIIFVMCTTVALGEHIFKAWQSSALLVNSHLYGMCGSPEYALVEACTSLLS